MEHHPMTNKALGQQACTAYCGCCPLGQAGVTEAPSNRLRLRHVVEQFHLSVGLGHEALGRPLLSREKSLLLLLLL